MIYVKDITTPANTSLVSCLQTRIPLDQGFVYKVEFMFPPGCSGLLHLVVCHGAFQIWPTSLGQSLHPDGYTVSFDDSYLIGAEPYELQAYTWNLDTYYEHLCQVRVGLVSEDVYIARFLPSYAYKSYQEAAAKLEAKQAEDQKAILTHPFPWLKKT